MQHLICNVYWTACLLLTCNRIDYSGILAGLWLCQWGSLSRACVRVCVCVWGYFILIFFFGQFFSSFLLDDHVFKFSSTWFLDSWLSKLFLSHLSVTPINYQSQFFHS